MFLTLDIIAETEQRLEKWDKYKKLSKLLFENDAEEEKIKNECMILYNTSEDMIKNLNRDYLNLKVSIILEELELGMNLLDKQEQELITLTYLKKHTLPMIFCEMYIDRSTYYRIRKRAIIKMSEVLSYYI